MPGIEYSGERPLCPLHSRPDEVVPVPGHREHEGRCHMLEITAPFGGLAPPLVPQQVEFDQFEIGYVRSRSGQGVPHFLSLRRFADASPDGIARREELKGDVTSEISRDAGNQNTIDHAILRLNESNYDRQSVV